MLGKHRCQCLGLPQTAPWTAQHPSGSVPRILVSGKTLSNNLESVVQGQSAEHAREMRKEQLGITAGGYTDGDGERRVVYVQSEAFPVLPCQGHSRLSSAV